MSHNLEQYFGEFVPALTAYLRPFRGQLGNQWLGIDRARKTMLIRRSGYGFSAFLTGRWMGAPVVITESDAGGRSLGGRFSDVHHRPGARILFWFATKHYRGEGKAAIGISHRDELEIRLQSPDSALGFLGLHYWAGLNPTDLDRFRETPTEAELRDFGARPCDPPWAVGFISSCEETDHLSGLDSDPLIAARGVADGILSFAGLLKESPKERYLAVAEKLRQAVRDLSMSNEASLQKVLEEYPWILIHEADYQEALPRPSLKFKERLASGSELGRRIEPDMIYHLPDSESLIVEIESARKRLLLSKTETSYRKPSAQASAAGFQIGNYKRLFEGFAGGALRKELARPDAWSFRFLLVVGSTLQPDFDQRDWINLRDHLGSQGISVRTWDYFLDRLNRLAEASDFAGSSGLGNAAEE